MEFSFLKGKEEEVCLLLVVWNGNQGTNQWIQKVLGGLWEVDTEGRVAVSEPRLEGAELSESIL